MKISVVIPAYNEEAYLGACLAALNSQTVPPDEIIVVDNMSTDKTGDIARAAGARVVRETRQGIAYARNAGFAAAKYDIVARTDADSCPTATWIATIKNCFEKKHMTAITGLIYYDMPLMDRNHLLFDAYQRLAKLIYGHWVWTGPNMIVSRKVWEACVPHLSAPTAHVHEDIDASIAVSRYATIEFVPELRVKSSGRRMRNNPASFFIEYQMRGIAQALDYRIKKGVETSLNLQKRFEDEIAQLRTETDENFKKLNENLIKKLKITPKELSNNLKKLFLSNPQDLIKKMFEKTFIEKEDR